MTRGLAMMGRLNQDQGQLFYSFCLEDVVPADHRVREIAAVLDLSWVHGELAPYYSPLGRPSIDPVLMIRMLILGYVFAIRSERLLCREVQVNLAYRWFCGLSMGRPSSAVVSLRWGSGAPLYCSSLATVTRMRSGDAGFVSTGACGHALMTSAFALPV